MEKFAFRTDLTKKSAVVEFHVFRPANTSFLGFPVAKARETLGLVTNRDYWGNVFLNLIRSWLSFRRYFFCSFKCFAFFKFLWVVQMHGVHNIQLGYQTKRDRFFLNENHVCQNT